MIFMLIQAVLTLILLFIRLGTVTPSWFNIDGKYYSTQKWEFIPSTNTQVTISTESNSFPSYLIDSALNVHLGIVQDSTEVQTLKLQYYKYDNGTGRFVPYGNEQTWYDYNRDGLLYKWSPGTSVNHNTYYSTDLVMYNTNNYQNNIIRLKITSLRNDLPDMYYIKAKAAKQSRGLTGRLRRYAIVDQVFEQLPICDLLDRY